MKEFEELTGKQFGPKFKKTEKTYERDLLYSLSRESTFRAFPIETEETMSGFPDILFLYKDGGYRLNELKVTHNGRIKFEPSQIEFFNNYKELNICIYVYMNNYEDDIAFNVKYIRDLKIGERSEHLCPIMDKRNSNLYNTYAVRTGKLTYKIEVE